jgi:hypothetical protein
MHIDNDTTSGRAHTIAITTFTVLVAIPKLT